MKKVAVNTRLLLKGRLEGLGTFKHEVLKRLVKAHPDVEFHFIFDRPFDKDFIYGDNVVPHVLGPQARHPFLFITWFDGRIPTLLKRIKPDVFFSPDGYLSTRTEIPQVPVIHDINFFHYPEYFSFWVRWHFNTYFPQFAKKALKIITISEFSKNDIAKNYRIDSKKIEVVYNGVEQDVLNFTNDEVRLISNRYTQLPYFIFIGALYPRKNLINQMKAFDEFKTETGSNVKFIIVGKSYPESDTIFEVHQQLKYKNDIIFTGRVEPRENVDKLLSGALACSYVSTFEGFGLPVLESMRAGVPVITSNTTALPEVAGNAAIMCNPDSVNEIKEAYIKVVSDLSLRNELINNGYNQMKKFTWNDTANKVWDVLEGVIAK